jgi:hypothetical protein
MANFYSHAYLGGNIFRTVGEQDADIAATVQIPAGYALTTSDKLYFYRVGANHSIDEVKARFDALDNAQTPTLTVDVGYEVDVGTDDPNAFIAASTLGRAGGQIQVENGGDDPFAVGALAPLTEVAHIIAVPAAGAATAAGTGDLGPGDVAGALTVTVKLSRKTALLDPEITPIVVGVNG